MSLTWSAFITCLFSRVLNFGWTDNIWADLPPLSALHTGEFLDVPGVLGGVQTSFFYEPVCVSLSPDPPQGFNELLNGTEGISSRYMTIVLKKQLL